MTTIKTQEDYRKELIKILEDFDQNKSADMMTYLDKIADVSNKYFRYALSATVTKALLEFNPKPY